MLLQELVVFLSKIVTTVMLLLIPYIIDDAVQIFSAV